MKNLVSIIMAAFNAEKYIEKAVDSALNQSHENIELCIINDGSNDRTKEIIDSYTDPRIRVFHQTNQGVSKARNIGLDHMKGDFFCFLDSDDILTKTSLEVRVNFLLNHPEVNYVDGQVLKITPQESRINQWNPDFKGYPLTELISLSGRCFFGPTWMIRNQPKPEIRFRENISHGEDLIYFIDLCKEIQGEYGFCQDVIMKYRTGQQSAMTNIDGLAMGYRSIYSLLCDEYESYPSAIRQFDKKRRMIILKCYLRIIRPFSALRYYILG